MSNERFAGERWYPELGTPEEYRKVRRKEGMEKKEIQIEVKINEEMKEIKL